ncbi:hypothetical protein FHS21_000084 [Phyllobacterium trifolii]|jgi:hypothetical protein|uniref:Uncharacterized protein n=1 Tax=Phyllobacterium trifolii TaxID=300193 RepID=A0A839U4P2_9HYPH|nr:hypothetical protein [Phyllobacterium trifolii]MBB3143701.1 hypothetical protein [Phyllobacterium trifolii]
MSIHQPPPRQPDLPAWLIMAQKIYAMFTVIEAAIRLERRQRERDIEALRSEIAALKRERLQ